MNAKYNGISLAFPMNETLNGFKEHGLTKRELFAAMVLQGFAADPNTAENTPIESAGAAVDWADALLAALEADHE